MARIMLWENETDSRCLPGVCMACGSPATSHESKTFSWSPPWTRYVPIAGFILYYTMMRHMRVEVPLCDRHRNYWLVRRLWMWVPFAILVLGGVGLVMLLGAAGAEEAIGITMLLGLLCFTAWLFVVVILQSIMIQPTEITDRSISLKCVHEDFANALYKLQDDKKERRRRRWDHDDDFDDRPRRRLRADYDEESPRRDTRTAFRPERDFEE